MKKLLLASTLLAAIGTTGAHAALQVAFSVGGSAFSCTDGAACDSSATTGVVAIGSETLGGVTIFGTFAASQTGPDQLKAINFQITNASGSTQTLLMAVGDDGFTGKASSFAGSAAGLWTNAPSTSINNAAYGFWVDNANIQGAANSLDLPGTNILDFLTNHSTGALPNSFADNGNAAFNATGPFSMTMGANFTLANGASLTGNEQAIQAVPEASTWAMAAAGFALVGLVGLRKRKSAVSIA